MFKRRPKHRVPHEPSPLKRFVFVFGGILLAALVLLGFWFLAQLGPRDVDFRDFQGTLELSEEVIALQQESIDLEVQFNQISAMREPEGEDIGVLKASLDKMEAYVDALPMSDSESLRRLRGLRARYQDYVSRELQEASLEYEGVAIELADDEEFEKARREYRKALDKQLQINEDFPLSSAYNVGRATRLERQISHLQAEPLLRKSRELEAAADAAIESREWREAEKMLQQAIERQDQLNREFRGSNQASVARLEQLRTKLVGIRSGQKHLEVEEVLSAADLRQANGEHLEAAGLYQEATRLQRELNEAFRDSPYASTERVLEFQRKADTSESYELGLEIESNHRRLDRLLSERRSHEATELIVSMRRDIRQMQEAFPRSSLNDEELELKIRYLNLIQTELGFIQDRVYDAVLPIPEGEGWMILRSEVTQALYSRIMGTNPSRNRGDRNPVDSVSWEDAKAFCERLSWIMGKEVRLPTENEFRKALGPLRYVVLEEHVWSVENAGGATQQTSMKNPFASGAYDLLGNVSEWLESINRFETEDARHIGGNAQDDLERIFSVPVRDASRSERNRMTGFRFVVESD